jgi:hypothetical protein
MPDGDPIRNTGGEKIIARVSLHPYQAGANEVAHKLTQRAEPEMCCYEVQFRLC